MREIPILTDDLGCGYTERTTMVDFVFSDLVPLTTSMSNQITKNLKAFFEDEIHTGLPLEKIPYQSVIFNTIDPKTRRKVVSFTLATSLGKKFPSQYKHFFLGKVDYPILKKNT